MFARIGPVAVALVLVGVLAGSATPSPARQEAARNAVVIGFGGDVSGFNTALACCNEAWAQYEGESEAIRGAFVEDQKGRWIRDLVSKASADRSGISYTIKPNAFWYWGGKKVPVTYRDFVYTLQQLDNPKNQLAFRSGYNQLDPARFRHHGDRQVRFFWRTTGCSTDFPCGRYANWRSLFGQVYPSFALTGQDFNKIWMDCICGSDGRPVANGPFYLASYTKGEGTTLKANPYYWAKPKLTEVDFRFSTDADAELLMLGGQVDAIVPKFGPALEQFKGVPGITLSQVAGYVFEHLELREGSAKGGPSVTKGASNVLLRAPWMRQAIMLGIDRQKIIDAVLGPPGEGIRPLQSAIFFSTQTGYRPAFQRWNYNPSKALGILKKHCDAGSGPSVPTPGSTKVWQCAGLPATLNWSWGAGHDEWTTSEQIASRGLESIGIRINERPFPTDTFFDTIGAGDFDIVEFRWINSSDPGDYYDVYRCSGDSNYTGYCNRRADALLTATQGEVNAGKRERLFQRVDAILAAEIPVIPLFQFPFVLVHRSKLVGMHTNPDGNFAWDIEKWNWRK